MQARKSSALTAHEIRRVSVEAFTDTRTVARYLKRLPMKSTTEARIRAAFERLGLPNDEGRQCQ